MTNPNIASLRPVVLTEPALDVRLAQRLAMRGESSAASCKAWCGILLIRLANVKPISAAGCAAGADVAGRAAKEARELADHLEALERLFGGRL